jgi:hypothetical protein
MRWEAAGQNIDDAELFLIGPFYVKKLKKNCSSPLRVFYKIF